MEYARATERLERDAPQVSLRMQNIEPGRLFDCPAEIHPFAELPIVERTRRSVGSGQRGHHFAIDFWPLRFNTLDPARLRRLLDASGIKRRVVVVSACYAGGFIDHYPRPIEPWVVELPRQEPARLLGFHQGFPIFDGSTGFAKLQSRLGIHIDPETVMISTPLDKYEVDVYELAEAIARETGLAYSKKKNRVIFPRDEQLLKKLGL